MKKWQWLTALSLGLLTAGVFMFGGSLRGADEPAGDKAQKKASKAAGGDFKTLEDKVSYGLGLNIGQKLKSDGLDLNAKLLAEGLQDALNGAEPKLSDEELTEAFTQFQKVLVAKQAEAQKKEVARLKELAERNQKEGEAWLAENKEKEGIVTTKSGLQYKVLKEGTGKSPSERDVVKTHYRGTLLDGTEFDSSHKRGEPATFPVGGVIPGWTEALQKMKVGSKWRLFVPGDLAYGERGSPTGRIGPNQVLVFDVELLEIIEQPKKDAKQLNAPKIRPKEDK